jgi:hypothetical protein
MNDTKFFQAIKWIPHERQKEVLKCDNKEVIVCAGRRFGKSALMGAIVGREFLKGLNDIKKEKRGSVKIFIVAPTYELSRKVFDYVVKFLLEFDKRFAKFVSERPQPAIRVSENVWVQCKSATEPFGMLGEELDLAIIDEAPLIPEKVYYQYIYPLTISKSRNCRTYLIGTPRGKDWFQRLFIRLKEKNASFHYTTLDGVETDEDALEEIKRVTPDLLFRQEYMAEFVDEAGTVFKNLDNVLVDYQSREPEANHTYTMGVDLGQVEDYTVMTVIDTTTNEVVSVDRFRGIDYPLQKQHIVGRAQRFNARVIVDATGVGRSIYEDLAREGLMVEDFTFSGKTKEELIGKLMVFVDNKYIKIPKIDFLVDELKAFQYEYLNEKTGEKLKNVKYGAPKGYHDDAVMSLALAIWGLPVQKPVVKTQIEKMLESSKKIKRTSFI